MNRLGLYKKDINNTKIQYESLGNDFSVNIKANSNNNAILSSYLSETKEFDYLDKVSKIYVEDGILKWEPVLNANAYILKLNDVIINDTITECYYDNLVVNKETNIQIMPISNDLSKISKKDNSS